MNPSQITYASEEDPAANQKFCGVFAIDELSEIIDKRPHGLVSNTDPSSSPGQHWVAFYFPSKHKGEFCGSYAHPPEF